MTADDLGVDLADDQCGFAIGPLDRSLQMAPRAFQDGRDELLHDIGDASSATRENTIRAVTWRSSRTSRLAPARRFLRANGRGMYVLGAGGPFGVSDRSSDLPPQACKSVFDIASRLGLAAAFEP